MNIDPHTPWWLIPGHTTSRLVLDGVAVLLGLLVAFGAAVVLHLGLAVVLVTAVAVLVAFGTGAGLHALRHRLLARYGPSPREQVDKIYTAIEAGVLGRSTMTPATVAAAVQDVERADKAAAALVPTSCPPWCTEAPGHGYYANGVNGAAGRSHEATVDTITTGQWELVVLLSQLENRDVDGTTSTEPVSATMIGELTTTDVAVLHRVARSVAACADQLAEIQAAGHVG
jgi:hypothetical protein